MLATAGHSARQCTTIVVYFVPKEDKIVAEPAAKRAKKEAESVRLRHIVVAWLEGYEGSFRAPRYGTRIAAHPLTQYATCRWGALRRTV